MDKKNPLIHPPKLKYNTVPFDLIQPGHFDPAFEYAIDKAKKEITSISINPADPSFENIILALECKGPLLDRITKIFRFLISNESTHELKDIANQINPKLAEFGHSILTNKTLLKKVTAVYDNRINLDLNDEQIRLVEDRYEWYIKNGANLSNDKQEELKSIKMELSQLGDLFSKNLLDSTNAYELHITDESELIGIPETSKTLMAKTAIDKGKSGGWLILLQQPFTAPILTYSSNRQLREKIFKKLTSRSFNDKFDNQDLILKKAKLSHRMANLLGHKTYADFKLQDRMAENVDNVKSFLDEFYNISKPKADEDMEMLRDFSEEFDGLRDLYGWDTPYYTDKLKSNTFGFKSEELKPYFEMENVVKGVFELGSKLYDISIERVYDVPLPHSDIRSYVVFDNNRGYLGQLWLDLFPRETKKAGGWMNTLQSQGLIDGEMKRPVVCIATNLPPATENHPSLLNLRGVEILFHEFGHALHRLLSQCTYTSLSGTNVYWDFVELPSQIMENFVLESEVLDLYAYHYKTGGRIPQDLVDKVLKSKTFFAGKKSINALTWELLDLAWYASNPENVNDVYQYESDSIGHTLMVPRTESASLSCKFSHIFSGGYAAGYYSYRWAEVLDADAFELFKEKGIFNKEVANSFRKNILAKGNTEHPMQLYKKFRGREPDSDALLLRSGLI